MKKINIKWVAGFVFLLMLSSCLKNNQYYTDFSSVGASVQLPLAARNRNKIVAFTFDASAGTIKIPVYVNVASPQKPSSSVSIKLGVDSAYLRQYNTANGTSFEVLPDSAYTTTGWDRTVQPGQRMDSMVVSINLNKLDLTHQYVLPVTIVSSSLPIEQWNHLLMSIGVKNKYDGKYTVAGYVSHPNPAFTGGFSDNTCGDFTLVTSGPGSVDLLPGQPFSNNGNLAVFGVYARFIIDPVTNKITAQDAAGSLGSVENFTDYNSRYDPATKTLYVKYGWNASRIAIDTLTYCGPR